MNKLFLALLFFYFVAFSQSNGKEESSLFVDNLKSITDVMVYDVTSPVAAARYYAYSTITAYELLSNFDSINYPSLVKISKVSFRKIQPPKIELNHKPILIRYGMLLMSSKILPSGVKLNSELIKLQTNLSNNEIDYVNKQVDEILKYVNNDGFNKLNTYRRYSPEIAPGSWQPTPPAFMSPVEPNWNTLKTIFLNEPDQFITKPPIEFDMNESSEFYKLVSEVKDVVNQKNPKKNKIASFWDCNPYAISQVGHLEFGLKKISPGGHWIGITGIACKKARISYESTILIHALVAATLHDAFISCWDEKYRSNRIRPETVIRKYMDPLWTPILQTPPFPEYTSGHSVASTAAAVILTSFFGENFKFVDTTEVEFGLNRRKFNSFEIAAQEASISRFYGGIHYLDAIIEGQNQGFKVGSYIVSKTKSLNLRLP